LVVLRSSADSQVDEISEGALLTCTHHPPT
jgi:hypothetical protein